jgi:hypothetical protein
VSSETHNLRRPPHPPLSHHSPPHCPLSLHQTLFDTHHPPCSRSHRLRSSSPRCARCSCWTTPTPVPHAPRPTRPRVPRPSWPSEFKSSVYGHVSLKPSPSTFSTYPFLFRQRLRMSPVRSLGHHPSSRLPFGHHPVDHTRSTSPLLSQGVRVGPHNRWRVGA